MAPSCLKRCSSLPFYTVLHEVRSTAAALYGVQCVHPQPQPHTGRHVVQGRCTTQPDAANFPGMNGVPMVATTSGQCFLLTHDDMLGVVNGQFWADNLYLRAALPEGELRQFHFPALVVVPTLSTGGIGSVYLTNMIFQGDGEGSVVGIGADDKVFVQGARSCMRS